MTNLKDFKILSLLLAATAVACSKGGAPAEEPPSDTSAPVSESPAEGAEPEDTPPPADTAAPGRRALTSEECTAQGGQIIGDIGDGAIHQPAYVCPSGDVPVGNVVASGEGPTAIEGSVCCR